MLKKDKSVIIKFDFSVEQTVGQITKVTGFMKAKYLIPVIDILDLKANPRSSKTGPGSILPSTRCAAMIFCAMVCPIPKPLSSFPALPPAARAHMHSMVIYLFIIPV